MTPKVTQTARRAAALSLLGALIGLLWLGVAQPILEYIDTASESRGIALRALKRNRALLHEEAAIQAARASVEHSPRWRNFYESPKTGSAALQMESDLRGIFRDSNNPTAMTAEPATLHGSMTRIAVRVTLSIRIDQLADALDRIQKQPHQLRIDSLTIQAPDFQASQVNPSLTVQAQISGMMIAPGPERT